MRVFGTCPACKKPVIATPHHVVDYTPWHTGECILAACDFCDGFGQVLGPFDQSVTCPMCKGNLVDSDYAPSDTKAAPDAT